MGLASPASSRTEGLVQCPCFVCTGCSCLVVFDCERNSTRLQVICIREMPLLGYFAGQRRSISVMISSAHRTASRDRRNCSRYSLAAVPLCQLPRRKNRGRDEEHALASFVHHGMVHLSLFVRY